MKYVATSTWKRQIEFATAWNAGIQSIEANPGFRVFARNDNSLDCLVYDFSFLSHLKWVAGIIRLVAYFSP